MVNNLLLLRLQVTELKEVRDHPAEIRILEEVSKAPLLSDLRQPKEVRHLKTKEAEAHLPKTQEDRDPAARKEAADLLADN